MEGKKKEKRLEERSNKDTMFLGTTDHSCNPGEDDAAGN
jgi:hypothetical protein